MRDKAWTCVRCGALAEVLIGSNLGLKITGTPGPLNDARQRSWLTDDACLGKARLLQSNGFRIPMPGANQTFAECLTAIE